MSNDMWNCPQAACGKQEVWANSSSDWGVVSNMAAGNTAVLTYPAVQELYGANNQPASLANASELVSTFAESMPTTSGTIGEAAYDIWLNGWNTEVMIWVDNQHQVFDRPSVGTATFNGQQFRIYVTHGVSHGYPTGPIFFVLQNNETSGTVDILAVFHWLERAGYLSATKGGLNAVDFGWEICSTNGVPENFSISHYTLSAKGIQLSVINELAPLRLPCPGVNRDDGTRRPMPWHPHEAGICILLTTLSDRNDRVTRSVPVGPGRDVTPGTGGAMKISGTGRAAQYGAPRALRRGVHPR